MQRTPTSPIEAVIALLEICQIRKIQYIMQLKRFGKRLKHSTVYCVQKS